jgi:hypothetical protein
MSVQISRIVQTRGRLMQDHTQESKEARKDWVAPELKKIDIEEITADGFQPGSDGVVTAEADAS